MNSFWLDKKIRRLDIREKLLFVYILNNNHGNEMGVFFLPACYIAYDLDWDIADVNQSLGFLCNLDLVHYSADSLVIVPYIWHKYLTENNFETIQQIINLLAPFKNCDDYDLLYDTALEKTHLAQQKVVGPEKDTEKKHPVKKQKKEKNTTQYEAVFEDFWKAYPRQDFRITSLKVFTDFLQNHPEVSPQTLTECAFRYAKSCQDSQTEKRYIKRIKGFLEDDFYKNFISDNVPKKKTSSEFELF